VITRCAYAIENNNSTLHALYIRLNDVVQSEGRLYLVFEFVDKDLKKYFEACEGMLSPQLIKV